MAIGFDANATMYIVGDAPFGGWNPVGGVQMTDEGGGIYSYKASINGSIYFVFSDGLDGNWDVFNSSYRIGPTNGTTSVTVGKWFTASKSGDSGSFFFHGNGEEYVITFDQNNMIFKIEGFVLDDNVYTVVGSPSTVFGTSWDPNNTDNDMKLVDGLFVLEKHNCVLGGTLELKIVANRDWSSSWPVNNWSCTVGELGQYDIVFTFDPVTHEISASWNKVSDTDILHTGEMFVMGEVNGNGWATNVGVKMSTHDQNTFNATVTAYGDVINENDGIGYSYFSFTAKLSDEPDSWLEIEPYRLGSASSGDYWVTEQDMGVPIQLRSGIGGNHAFRVTEGIYNLTVNLDDLSLVIKELNSALIVNFPADVNMEDYANMRLVLTNIDNGHTTFFIVSDKSSYCFSGIESGTNWSVSLKNAYDDILGKIDNIHVDSNALSVSFESLLRPQDVTIMVKTPNGNDVTDQTIISWLSDNGVLIGQGNQINGLPVGRKLNYQIALPQELATAYSVPTNTIYTVRDGGNLIVCQLITIGQARLYGKVNDAINNKPITDATISVTQSFGNGNSKTFTTSVDEKGAYSIEASLAPTSITYAAQGYISQTLNCDSLMSRATGVALPDIKLCPIEGAVINFSYTYTPAHSQNEVAEIVNWYDDYKNVDYEIYNKTTGTAITDINIQYPQIVLMSPVNDGDVLEITAISRKNAFDPITVSVIVEEQKATVTFNVREYGKIASQFNKNSNPNVVGLLYDCNGKLIKSNDYSDGSIVFDNLTDGEYTLVTMGMSDFFNTIYDMSEFVHANLVSGVDYFESNVEVHGGLISNVVIDQVPFLDESKLYFTGDKTSLSVNKPMIVIGNYLTFRAQIDFMEQFAEKVNNVQLIIDLPESCSFVDNSVLVGSASASYSMDNHRITIPLINYASIVRFCAIPTVVGNYSPSAFVRFELNGKTITQPIGASNYIAQDLSINVPSITSKKTIPITGFSVGSCAIKIYDNNVLIGQTTSLADGFWSAKCTLNDPYNLSVHNIYAEVSTEQGLDLKTEVSTCTYDKNAIDVSKVHMYYTNNDIVFDYQNPEDMSSDYYAYVPTSNDFTFTIDFIENDTTQISNVVLYVRTSDNKWTPLTASFDSQKNCWITSGRFDDSALPVNVSVDYKMSSKIVGDRNRCQSIFNYIQTLYENEVTLNYLLTSFQNAVDSKDETLIESLSYQIDELINYDFAEGVEDPYEELTEEDFELMESYLDSIQSEIIWHNLKEPTEFVDEDGVNHVIKWISFAESGITTSDLNGYLSYTLDDNSIIYYYANNDSTVYLDPNNDLCVIEYNSSSRTNNVHLNGQNLQNLLNFVNYWSEKYEYIQERYGPILEVLKTIQNFYDSKILEITEKIDRFTRFTNGYEGRPKTNGFWRALGITNESKGCLEKFTRISNALGKFLKFFDVAQILNDFKTAISSIKEWCDIIRTINSIECDGMDALSNRALHYATMVYRGYEFTLKTELAMFLLADKLAKTGPGLVVVALVNDVTIIQSGINQMNDISWKADIRYEIPNTKNCNNDPKPEPDEDSKDFPGEDKKHGIDPSGFVYEGVPSNRLKGVTATCYYKETVEDMYGDLQEEVVLWDATQYGQENPLLTDENGYYRWDVPVGMWQVKYEKEGYETTYSDWLPVPPPQLDVNIGMVQMRQPEVIKARAYLRAVEFEFDKFMLPETLTSDNITVTVNGSPVSGTIELLNVEVDDPLAITPIRRAPGTGLTFASRVRFNASSPFNADKVTLHIKQDVKSYADLQMNGDYVAVLPVEYEIERIASDSTANVLYGDSRQLIVAVEPSYASHGKTLTVRTVSPMILSTDAEKYTLDSTGKAVVTVHGDLPGNGSLLFGVEGYDLCAATLVNVLMESQMSVATPTASIASGSEVEKGTAVYLRCATEGATIYYTLDGSCPCDNTPALKIYDGNPIIINSTVTIKAMATAPDLYDSDVAAFVYRVGNGLKGDVNADGEVNVADINSCIDIILGGDANSDVRSRADVNGDAEINVADINAIIDIILGAHHSMKHSINCDDLLHVDDVTMKPGEVRALNVMLDNANRYSGLQFDIVLPAGITLVGVSSIDGHISRADDIDGILSRAVSYSMNKRPFVGDTQPVLTFIVRSDAALAPDSEIMLTDVVLADADNRAWYAGDCTVRVNNASGINDLTVGSDRVWLEGKTLCIEARQDGIARITAINGVVYDINVKTGINRRVLDQGIYVVVINGKSYKIAVK